MVWTREKSAQRIRQFQQEIPSTVVDVARFDNTFETRRRVEIAAARSKNPHLGSEPLIADLPHSAAVVVDAVHVYCQLLDYHDALMEQQRETEASHRRALGMLHLHYAGCDRLTEEFDVQRVDFHGPRLHAVIATPANDPIQRAYRAMQFAQVLKAAIEEAGRTIAGGRFQSRVRIGIESGEAIAINSGSKNEREPLFLGPAANIAAKLTEGTREGIYLGERMRTLLNSQQRLTLLREGFDETASVNDLLQRAQLAGTAGQLPSITARQVADELASSFGVSMPNFSFHHHAPPLKTIRFADLSPSNSIRMAVVSAFADIEGFSAYVERCLATGRVPELVSTIHVIRQELAATMREDFGGRKIRFIGDCIHALIAEGDDRSTDDRESVHSAVSAAGGMRSSFDLCLQMLQPSSPLGLAIGLELGPTPISRIGLRGERSVRCSSSIAVSMSETLQSRCDGTETALGPRALAAAPRAVARLFEDGAVSGLDYATVEDSVLPAPAIVVGSSSLESRAHLA